MKKLVTMTAVICAFAAQSIPAFADATGAQKQRIEQARTAFSEAIQTDEGCKVMCEEMLKHEKSKKMICEMIANDPECMKMMKAK